MSCPLPFLLDPILRLGRTVVKNKGADLQLDGIAVLFGMINKIVNNRSFVWYD
jgi:stress response protein SCP2